MNWLNHAIECRTYIIKILTKLSPAGFIAPGERTGQYRIGTDQLVVNKQGESRISAEDYAVALLDELENHAFSRRRFTVAY